MFDQIALEDLKFLTIRECDDDVAKIVSGFRNTGKKRKLVSSLPRETKRTQANLILNC